jgi:hypothetical protein
MPANKTQPTAVPVTDYLNTLADTQQRADAFALAALMQTASGLPPKMWGPAIIGFGEAHYVYESGREGDWFFIGFAPRKAALTLYAMGGWKNHPELLAKLGKHTLSSGCLYIKRLSDVDQSTLKQLCQAAAKQAKASAQRVSPKR